MVLIFNELSINRLPSDNSTDTFKVVEAFVHTIVEARKNGIKNIRTDCSVHEIYLAENYTLGKWLQSKNTDKNFRDLIFSIFTYPFIDEDNEYIQTQYVENKFYYINPNDITIKQECLGLASAYLSDTITISLQTNSWWKKNHISMIVENEEQEVVNVLNVFSQDCFSDTQISEYIGRNTQPELVFSNLEPDEKKIHLADHHGKQELQALCQKLKNNPYIIEMRSMEWCRGNCNKFIKKFTKEGVIEVVLTETKRKYGLMIKTTGRNYWETHEIAKIIDERYS